MSQSQQILKALKKGRRLTPLDALTEWGCFRLGARIYDLKERGYDIATKIVTSSNGKRFAQYSMVK